MPAKPIALWLVSAILLLVLGWYGSPLIHALVTGLLRMGCQLTPHYAACVSFVQ